MKPVLRYIKHSDRILASMKLSDFVCHVHTDDAPDLFAQQILDCDSLNLPVTDDVDKAILDRIRKLPKLLGCGFTAARIRNGIIHYALEAAGFFVFYIQRDDSIFFVDNGADVGTAERVLAKLNALFTATFNTTLSIRQADGEHLEELETRKTAIIGYYVTEHGQWTQAFLDTLGDDLSRISLRHFLCERVRAHLWRNAIALYPVRPPKETEEWRKQRIANPPPLPILEGCPDGVRDFFYLDSFIYEQYAIPGLVEAMPGQTVIDAGAFIGDTSLYFSGKVGNSGHVYAFEAMPESAQSAMNNMKSNGVTNVTMVPMALSDRTTTLRFSLHSVWASASAESTAGEVEVQATDLDSFVAEHNLHVGYLKADVEGGEMALLRGAAKTIARDKPICGIALYHRQGDYHEIPKYLQALVPEYRFYFRCEAEPVLFAVARPS